MRFLAKALGFGKLVADVLRALVERLCEHSRNLQVGQKHEEEDKADEGKESSVESHGSGPLRRCCGNGSLDFIGVGLGADQLIDDG